MDNMHLFRFLIFWLVFFVDACKSTKYSSHLIRNAWKNDIQRIQVANVRLMNSLLAEMHFLCQLRERLSALTIASQDFAFPGYKQRRTVVVLNALACLTRIPPDGAYAFQDLAGILEMPDQSDRQFGCLFRILGKFLLKQRAPGIHQGIVTRRIHGRFVEPVNQSIIMISHVTPVRIP